MKIDIDMLTECISDIIMNIGELTFEMGFSPNFSELPDTETYVGTVHILGDFNGSVKVTMSRELARGTTMRLLDIQEGTDLSFFHIAQFMQEFTNMTGGNLKPVLGDLCALSVPKCIETVGFHHPEPDTTRIIEVDFFCADGGFLSVQLFTAVSDLKEQVRAAASTDGVHDA
jgi:CheY-specific phosphatase CheX